MAQAPPDAPSARGGELFVRGVTQRFDDFVALDQVSLEVAPGRIVVILGGSGAGKTTLLRLLIGLDRPSEGAIVVDGVDIARLPERQLTRIRRKFGMVFQYSALLDSLDVLDNVAFPLREHTRLPEPELRRKVIAQLAELGLEGVEHRFPSQLSGGMRKRVALARALMLEPSILVYDEPTSGLDPLTSRRVDELIRATRDRYGVTSVVISHDMASALDIADHVYLLSRGRIVGDGTPAELAAGKAELASQFLAASGVDASRILAARGRRVPAGP